MTIDEEAFKYATDILYKHTNSEVATAIEAYEQAKKPSPATALVQKLVDALKMSCPSADILLAENNYAETSDDHKYQKFLDRTHKDSDSQTKLRKEALTEANAWLLRQEARVL